MAAPPARARADYDYLIKLLLIGDSVFLKVEDISLLYMFGFSIQTLLHVGSSERRKISVFPWGSKQLLHVGSFEIFNLFCRLFEDLILFIRGLLPNIINHLF
ncbi:hypothetical protein IEQ34_006341 [Dendrobium chrysotoxum]|uniref:Uncharacterized protein n=1 Tax=Dendrobium chrysotoxum TaxID=161865 RepID=A0AAV7HF75_DENCH|nr:hypothetical protein IEQ34_006341 [Dendrobium chrysotoxum]